MTAVQFLELLISLSIQATIVVCVTHWLCLIVKNPHLHCRLWNSCHLLLLLVMASALVLPHLRAVNLWHQLPPQFVERVVATETVVGRIALVIWLGGAMLSLGLLAGEWGRAFRFLKSCRAATAAEAAIVDQIDLPALQGEARKLRRPVRLLISQHLGSPFCCQWHQPHLVVPEFLLEQHPEEIKLIARHELEHLRSGHPLQLFLERLVATVFWFHPAIWWASQQASLAREYACDDAAVSEQREIVSYLKVLVALAERGLTEESEGATLFFGRGASMIALRGRRLLGRVDSPAPATASHRLEWAHTLLVGFAVMAWMVWVPLDALASSRTSWSPWPQWSASVLRTFEIPARDFEPYETRTRLHELNEQFQQQSESENAEALF